MKTPLTLLDMKNPHLSDLKSEFHFPGLDKGTTSQAPSSANDDNLIHRCYELVPKGETSLKLSFHFRNGNRCTIPYAYIVRTEYKAEGVLTFFTHDIQIAISGRGLAKIDNWLAENQLKWIKQHAVAIDPQYDDVFISDIQMKDRQ